LLGVEPMDLDFLLDGLVGLLFGRT